MAIRAPTGSFASSAATNPSAEEGATSRPSVIACSQTGTPSAVIARHAASTCTICPCTPPSDTTPIRCAAPPAAFTLPANSTSAGLAAKDPSSTARSIAPRSIATTRPAPILVCPTSELPICPEGSPTSGPWVISLAFGQVAQSRLKFGTSACAGALPSRLSESPQPSRMHSTTGFGTLMADDLFFVLPVPYRPQPRRATHRLGWPAVFANRQVSLTLTAHGDTARLHRLLHCHAAPGVARGPSGKPDGKCSVPKGLAALKPGDTARPPEWSPPDTTARPASPGPAYAARPSARN